MGKKDGKFKKIDAILAAPALFSELYGMLRESMVFVLLGEVLA